MVCSAQIPKEKIFVKHYDLGSGISQCVINDLVEDKKGFIWIATLDGLNRFDGYDFKIFRYEPNDSLSLPTSKINKIFYDRGKHLWLYTDNGLVVFNIEKGQIVKNSFLKKGSFKSVCLADDKTLWVYSRYNQLLLIDKNDFSVIQKTKENYLMTTSEPILNAFGLKNKVLLVGKNGSVYTYNLRTNSWMKRSPHFGDEQVNFSTACYDQNETIYLGSLHMDLLEYNTENNTFEVSIVNQMKRELIGVNDILYDSSTKSMLISTYGQGIFSYNTLSQSIVQYKQGDELLPLAANYSKKILRDRNGTIWIGYDGKGLDVLDPNLKKFTPTTFESPVDEFNLKFVRRIIEDNNGTIWFATSGSGLVEYNPKKNTFTFHNKGPLLPQGENFILEMVLVKDDIWLGLNGGGIYIFSISQGKVVKQIKTGSGEDELGSGSVWSFYYDKVHEGVWVGSAETGISLIETRTWAVKKYFSGQDPIFKQNGVRCFVKNRRGELIVGSTKGILRFNEETDSFERVYPKDGSPLNNSHSIKCLYEDHKGRFWLGSDGAGITILDSNYQVIRSISTADKLSNNVIYGILNENKYSLWVSSNKGLSNINWSEDDLYKNGNFLIYNYEAQSGLQGNEFNTGSYLKLKDGTLAFGGTNGVNIFRGEDIRPSKITPKVVITDFSVFNRRIKENKLITYIDELDLAYNQNSFSLKFNTVGFTIPDKVQYRYRLIGYDEEWVEADQRTYVSYTNLDPGEYEFQVSASNYDGFWNKDHTSLKISISSPIYMRWWFILGILSLLSFIIWSFIRNKSIERSARESLKLQYTKEIAEVEMKALRAQINPHFLFNSLNSINNFILKNENAKARKYLVKFSQLVRNILNNSTNPYLSLKEELDTINLYVQIESMRFDNQFNFDLTIEKGLNINQINIPSLLLQPYIENAIWHGLLHKAGEKNIEIRIHQRSEDTISIAIEDNGIGRKEAQKLSTNDSKRRSYGMQLGENRLKLMNSEKQSKGDVEVIDLYDDQGNGTGTLIEITLPIIESTKRKPINQN